MELHTSLLIALSMKIKLLTWCVRKQRMIENFLTDAVRQITYIAYGPY